MKFTNAESLAMHIIRGYLIKGEIPEINDIDVVEFLKNPAACFVTVYFRGELRGCIGNVDANRPLYRSVINNAVSAAGYDDRFEPLSKADLPDVTVEVTVLSPLTDYRPESEEKLLDYLKTKRPGLVIAKQSHQAIFLPQVWEKIPDPEKFLSELCLKAGLPESAWKEGMDFRIFSQVQETDLM
jgi:AmmeMemoRadiSam system protein A